MGEAVVMWLHCVFVIDLVSPKREQAEQGRQWRQGDQKVKVNVKSRPTLWAPWTVVYQAPLSMGFSRQEYWSGLPFHSPGDLSDPGIKPLSPELLADASLSEPPGKSK